MKQEEQQTQAAIKATVGHDDVETIPRFTQSKDGFVTHGRVSRSSRTPVTTGIRFVVRDVRKGNN